MRTSPSHRNALVVLWDKKRQQFRMSVDGIKAIIVVVIAVAVVVIIIKHWG